MPGHHRHRGSTIGAMRLRLARCASADLRCWTGLTGPQLQYLVEQLWNVKPDEGRGRHWRCRSPTGSC
jgi:hypothetical protein